MCIQEKSIAGCWLIRIEKREKGKRLPKKKKKTFINRNLEGKVKLKDYSLNCCCVSSHASSISESQCEPTTLVYIETSQQYQIAFHNILYRHSFMSWGLSVWSCVCIFSLSGWALAGYTVQLCFSSVMDWRSQGVPSHPVSAGIGPSHPRP